ncbi:MAG TPA: hypothetical protein VGA92_09395, partial [Candidatus Nitrosotenuis sp.]
MKKITVLLIVILFCSYITPAYAESSPEILYSGLVSGGGPEIVTETHYWGFCKIWVETGISKSYSNGFVRNNPDKSFYPGDGFGYIFVYGWA